MNFPKLQKGQYAVLRAKILPSLFLGLGPSLDLRSGKWTIFETLAAARDYAIAEITGRPSVECGIYDAGEQQVQSWRL